MSLNNIWFQRYSNKITGTDNFFKFLLYCISCNILQILVPFSATDTLILIYCSKYRDEKTPLTKYKKVEILKTRMPNIKNVLHKQYPYQRVLENDCQGHEVFAACKAPGFKVVSTDSALQHPEPGFLRTTCSNEH